LDFHHSAVRDLGPDIIESVDYKFEFKANGEYTLQWCRDFGGWPENKWQMGSWTVEGETVACLSKAGSLEVPERSRYKAGIAFAIPVAFVLAGRTCDDAPQAVPWERPILSNGYEAQGCEVTWERVEPRATTAQEERVDRALFVEVDGALVEVCPDIRENYPREDWARLMGFRSRFGIR
jgi:hypothetical protein